MGDGVGGDDSVTMTGTEPVSQTTIDGGTGLNSFSLDFSGAFTEYLQLLDIESANLSVGGDFSGNLTSEENLAAPGTGVINSLFVGGSVTVSGSIDAGAIFNVTIIG